MYTINTRNIEHIRFTFHFILLRAIYIYIYISSVMFFDTLRSWFLQSLVLFRRSLHCVTSSTYSKYLYSRSPVTNACGIDVVIIKLEMTLIWSKCKILLSYITANITTVCPASMGARRMKVKWFHVEEYYRIFMRCKLEGTDTFRRSSYNLTVVRVVKI